MATQPQLAATTTTIDHDDFKTVQLFKDQVLGIGAYGKVCKAKCDDLLCAAKLLHETLFDPNVVQRRTGGDTVKEHRLPMKRFEQECEFLSTIRHPNIVQYLGTHQDPDTGLPVLLMELMDDSLTHFLESSTQPIPYHIQVNICHDITLALSYLHNRHIVHRDLSSNNVLMIGTIRAKVTDFGMARLGDLHSQATHLTFTTCPGTDVYMPPEAVDENPVYLLYTEKIDCFSFGVLTVQVLTREFPKPGDRQVTVDDPRYPRALKMSVPEIDRRQNHISQADPSHPLLPIALDCLKDRDVERPSAQQLCERVATLKGGGEYAESMKKSTQEREKSKKEGTAEKGRETNSVLEQAAKESEGTSQREQAVRASQQQEIHQLRQQEMLRQQGEEVRRVEREKERAVEEKERQLKIAREILEERDEMIAFYEQRFDNMKPPQAARHQPNYKSCGLEADTKATRGMAMGGANNKQIGVAVGGASSKQMGVAVGGANMKLAGGANVKLRWKRGNKAPCKTHQWNDAVIDGHVIYFRSGVVIYSYDTKNDKRHRLQDCPYTNCSIAIVDKLLTAIGGKGLNQLFSLTGEEGSSKSWTEEFPPMPTKRNCTTALSTGAVLKN